MTTILEERPESSGARIPEIDLGTYVRMVAQGLEENGMVGVTLPLEYAIPILGFFPKCNFYVRRDIRAMPNPDFVRYLVVATPHDAEAVNGGTL